MTNDAIIRTNDYLELFNNISKKGILEKNEIPLINSLFNHYGINVEALSLDFWRCFIKLSTYSDNETRTENKIFNEIYFTQITDSLSYESIIEIYYLCLRFGLFNIGYKLRDYATNQILKNELQAHNDQKELLLQISASLELNKIEDSIKLIKQTIKNYPDSKLEKHISLLNILAGNNNLIDFYNTKNDHEFHKYISGKTVAVVGPAIPTEKNGTEIDKHELVVKLNYMKDYHGSSDAFLGKKCDITYFNGGKGDFFINNQKSELPNKIQWAVFRSNKYVENYFKSHNMSKNARSLQDYSSAFLCENLNMIQHTICDILTFHSSKIHIYNVDLFLTDGRYREYNPKGYLTDSTIEKKRDICRSAVHHDPYTQYQLLHNLWTNNLLSGDNKFSKVMNLGCRRYMERLQSIYGNLVRLNNLNDECQFI